MRQLAAFVAAALVVVPVAAETLQDEDGVRLSATVEEIETGAAVCRIREERHTSAQYEKLKPNDGRPLDVWRAEFVVASYSGRALEHSERSPERGVELAAMRPPGRPREPLREGGRMDRPADDDLGRRERAAGRGERSEVEFVLGWHEDNPALDRRSFDPDFGDAAPVPAYRGAAGTLAATPSRSVLSAAALPEPPPVEARPSRQALDVLV